MKKPAMICDSVPLMYPSYLKLLLASRNAGMDVYIIFYDVDIFYDNEYDLNGGKITLRELIDEEGFYIMTPNNIRNLMLKIGDEYHAITSSISNQETFKTFFGLKRITLINENDLISHE